MQRVLITGVTGMLGSKIAEHLSKIGRYEVVGTGRKIINASYKNIQADLLNGDEISILLQAVQPDVIVHCAANVNLNDCETHPENAYNIHINVSKKLAQYNSGICKLI